MGLNLGFANPDPRFDEWKPSEEYVPKAGTKKDSRFMPAKMSSAASRRPNQMEDMASGTRTNPSVVASEPKPSVATQLDGNGSWADWGVNVSGASRYLQDYEEEKAKTSKAAIDNTLASKPVPLNIEGMNKVLAERAKAASASATAAYANGTSPRADFFDIEAPMPADVGSEKKKSAPADTTISVKDQVPKSEAAATALGARLELQALIPSLTRPVSDGPSVYFHTEYGRPSTVTLVNGEESDDTLGNRAEKKQVDARQRDENIATWRQGTQLNVDIDDEVCRI